MGGASNDQLDDHQHGFGHNKEQELSVFYLRNLSQYPSFPFFLKIDDWGTFSYLPTVFCNYPEL